MVSHESSLLYIVSPYITELESTHSSDGYSSCFCDEKNLYSKGEPHLPDHHNTSLCDVDEMKICKYDSVRPTYYEADDENDLKKIFKNNMKKDVNKFNERLFVPIGLINKESIHPINRALTVIKERIKRQEEIKNALYDTDEEFDEREYCIIDMEQLNIKTNSSIRASDFNENTNSKISRLFSF